MTPQEFIAKWGPGGASFALNERQGAQAHFTDLCHLLGVPTPGTATGTDQGGSGEYIFEQDTLVLGEARGYADVFYRNHFAWENKAPGKNLDAALKQLLTYSLALSNPPLLVVCDRLTTRIHTQFNGHPSEVHTVLLAELDQPEKQALLRRLWTDPESFRPQKTSRDITEAAAKSFATLADGLRKRGPGTPAHADEVAHFLTQCLFCFFAEDVGLLPGRMFEALVNKKTLTADKLTQGLSNLFATMRDGGLYGNDDIPWFNGGLFQKVKVPLLTIMEVTELRNAANLNWSAIDVSIFGTLFERGLDPSKRSQLGAHYTDPATILRIVEPVLIRPLLQKWELVAQAIRGLQAKSTKKGDRHYKAASAQFALWLEELNAYRVLDPACGSGNFLFMGLKALKDIEHKTHLDAVALGLDRQADLVTGPHNVLGIELNEYAAELARVTVWIGELQWRLAHGYDFNVNPVLQTLDHIECRDALLSFGGTELRAGAGADAGGSYVAEGAAKSPPTSAPAPARNPMERGDAAAAPAAVAPATVTEASWPRASVVIGNPPFLGGSKKRRELGDDYFEALALVFKGRVPAGADLVCYWFDKARLQIANSGLGAAGFVATQSIRAGSNRQVLDAIVAESHIFDAWADEPWVNDGAAVRVSLINFGLGRGSMLNGQSAARIAADLSSNKHFDITHAVSLSENSPAAFKGAEKSGSFEVAGETARHWLVRPNPHDRSSADVLLPWRNGSDISDRAKDHWIVDFGVDMSVDDASLYEAPFAHLVANVKQDRLKNNDRGRRENWWRFGRNGADMRNGVLGLPRFLVTVRVSKHRYFVWLPLPASPDSRLLVVARADDTTFGILSSRIHEVWSLAQASIHGDGEDGGRPTYNAKSCFETFPFPAGLTPADTAHQRTETLEGGAVIPADPLAEVLESNQPAAPVEYAKTAIKNVASIQSDRANPKGGRAAKGSAQVKEEPAKRAEDTEQSPLPPGHPQRNEPTPHIRTHTIAIAQAAKRLNDLRDNWLNPKEWTDRVPEVIPLGMTTSPYPDRILPKPGFEKDLAERTLTKLYNQRPAWLDSAHKALDLAVAQAYGWTDYTADMPDDEILKRLLALNLERHEKANG